VRVAFSLLCAFLPSLSTLQLIDQQHFTKTKMEYISLPSNLNVIIGITSYYRVILKFVILHHAIKTIQTGVIVFYFKKRTYQNNPFKKTKKFGLKQKLVGCFFKGFFSTVIVFQSFL